MKQNGERAKRDLFLPILLCAIIAIVFNAASDILAGHATQTPVAREGIIDLSGWNFAERGNVPLNGQWEFYPDQLLNPQQLAASSMPHRYISVPGPWTRTKAAAGDTMGRWGYGTYRLIAKVNDTNVQYAIRTHVVFMSSKLFVDGKLVGSSGRPATNKQDYQPQNLPYTAVFNAESDYIEIVMQVANFDHYSGGIGVPLYLGYQTETANSVLLNTGIQTGSSMVLLVFGGFFIILFAVYIRDASLLLFALFFICLAGNILVNGEKVLLHLFSQIDFELSWKCKNLTIYVEVPILYFLTAKMYGSLQYVKWLAIPALIVGGYCAAIAILPYSQYIVVEKAILDVVILFHLLLFAVLAFNYWKRNCDADGKWEFRYYTASMLVLLVFKVYNILYVRYYAPGSWVAPAAIIFFILLIVLMLVQRYYRAYSAIAGLMEKLRDADRMKDEFLLRTSVELKTPIQRILNLAESLKEADTHTSGGEPGKDKLQMVSHTAFRMSNMVDDLVDLAKIRDGRLVVNVQTADIAACTSMVFEVFRFIADSKRIELRQRINPEARYATADENRLMQVLYHLIDNGLRHVEQGSIAVGSRRIGGNVEITIEMDGKGSLLDNREVLMQVFDNRQQATGLDSRGLGWSFAIVDKLVELMKGTFRAVWADQRPSCCYEITLPVGKPDESVPISSADSELAKNAPQVRQDEPPAAASSNGDYTVLVVEEEAAMLEVLIHLLAMEGYRVVTARSRAEANLRVIGPNRPDVVLINMMMDGGSGYETVRAIRRRFSPIELPILFVAARNTPADVEAGLMAGGNDYITKPVDAGEVRARIRTLLAMKRLAKEAALNEMAFLQSQIKPHFLYNALGTIMSLCYTDGRKAGKLLSVFSKYLRTLFQFDNTGQLITISKEMELIRAYTEIEKARFGEKLEFVAEVEPELFECRIAPLTIQPLVENAIRHGIAKQLKGGRVRLLIERKDEFLIISVEDNGVGMSVQQIEEVLSRTTTGRGGGFASVNKRILQLTDKPLVVESVEGKGTRITLCLPIQL